MKKFNELPDYIQDTVRSVLKIYDEAYVVYQNGEYNVTIGMLLANNYPKDHEMIGRYTVNEVLTKEERIISYAEMFHSFHPEYRGIRDYNMMKQADRDGWLVSFELDEAGNLKRKE